MIFAKERVEVICAQLKKLMTAQTLPLEHWQHKHGLFMYPQEADVAQAPWEEFDTRTMHWYGPDAHDWFRTELTVPESFNNRPLWFMLHTQLNGWDARNPQFLLFVDGQPVQGFDTNHQEIRLADCAKAGQTYRLDIQAYSGNFAEDAVPVGELSLIGELADVDPRVSKLYYDLCVPLWSLDRMDKNGKTRIDLETALNSAINLLDLREPNSEAFYASVEDADRFLQKAIYTDLAGCDDIIATCIGHTHIDVAWWWTVAQTREKVARSFSTVLKLMEEYPEYKFMSSQPQLYAFLKERYPAMFEQIKSRVAEGRWEPEGGMWLEADCNLTSGESLVRQFLYGKQFFKEEFGVENRILWLPDVFGYSGALPQIMKKCGVDYFMTTKLSWNQFNKVPNDTLMWEGIDGTQVLTHFISTLGIGQSVERFFTTYNGMLHPDAIIGGWERYQNKEMNNDVLIAYGYGDGGGGPTREMLEIGERMEVGLKGVPKVRQAFARQYFDELEARIQDSPRLPVWTGEFYFEYHRGTYTSMARNKRGNRKSELMLMDLELLSVLAADKGVAYPSAQLEAMWKKVLLNQFHDILPGSSIKEVYEVTREEYDWVARETNLLCKERMSALAPAGDAVTVFNTLGFDRSGLVELPAGVEALEGCPAQELKGKRYAYVEKQPSKGYAAFSRANVQAAKSPFQLAGGMGGASIETPYYTVQFDKAGQISSLLDKEARRELVQFGKAANVLRVYEDKPIYYDNWDIDVFYTEKFWDALDVTSMSWVEDGCLAAVLETERSFAHSVIRQRVMFYAHSRRIDFETYVDWHESQHLLKVLFPMDLHSDEATFDVQFGNVKRKTHTNTSWDMARFESCGHKWVDVSEGAYGVSLLNDCKYGHAVQGGEMALTLIKSGIEPNPTTDQEEHFFTYALYPHMEGWQQGGTQEAAADLNQPALAVCGGKAGERYSFVQVFASNVVLETVKQAENGSGVIIRVFESRNCRTQAEITLASTPKRVLDCDLLENPGEALPVDGNAFRFTIRPYEIRTFLVEF